MQNAKKGNLAAVNVKPGVSLAVATEMTEIVLRSWLLIWLNWRDHFKNF